MEKPDNLIPEEKMLLILEDFAIVNAAKTTNMNILRNQDIEPTAYILSKYGIDSLQFVESDRYYASLPDEYEAIYQELNNRLEKKKSLFEEEKKIKDSLKVKEQEELRLNRRKIKDSLR